MVRLHRCYHLLDSDFEPGRGSFGKQNRIRQVLDEHLSSRMALVRRLPPLGTLRAFEAAARHLRLRASSLRTYRVGLRSLTVALNQFGTSVASISAQAWGLSILQTRQNDKNESTNPSAEIANAKAEIISALVHPKIVLLLSLRCRIPYAPRSVNCA
jgi:hypothetical protein